MVKDKFSYYIKIFGCQMNYVDAEIIVSTLAERGGKAIPDPLEANLVVAVTCGVRASAEERIISWTKKARDTNKNSVIVLTGCLSHRKDVESRLENVVDLFIPIESWVSRLHFVINRLDDSPCRSRRRSAGRIIQKKSNLDSPIKPEDDSELNKSCDSKSFYRITPRRTLSFQAYIPIITGCNNFCSYCVVPYARGREKSLAPEKIISEAKRLIRKGYKELYLLGQNVNSYRGVDKRGKQWNFSRLLRTIDEIPGNFWIRFISSHPKAITSEFIETFASCRKVSPNLHLPIQSGSSRILKLMNRGYARENYLSLTSKIRRAYPNVVFSTDIIVGFPGETEKDFQDSLDIVKKVGFESVFSLKYSPRPETAAFRIRDSVAPEVKIARQRKLDAAWKKIAEKMNQRLIGQTITILVDRVKYKTDKAGKNRRFLMGKSFDNKDVLCEVAHTVMDPVGKWATVKIKNAGALALKGELVRVEKNV